MRRTGKTGRFVAAAVCFILLFSLSVFADFGPKPGTSIVIENPPDGIYYLDLLIEDGESDWYSNLTEEEMASCREDMLAVLEALSERYDGWHTALVDGTVVPLFGSLVGTAGKNGNVHTFRYYGVPDTYRIVVVTEDLQVYTSEVFHKTIFQETVSVRLDSSEASGNVITVTKTPSQTVLYLKQFALTLLPTLLIEFLFLLLFKIPIKRNIAAFLGVNVATQLLLTVIMTRTLISSGLLSAYFLLAPVKLVILAIEAAAYAFLLRDVTRPRRIAYAVVANLVSAALGYWLIGIADSWVNVL